jgi:adiponectin receptor
MVFDAILRFRLRSKPDNYSAVDKYTSESPGNGAPPIQPRRRPDATPTPTPTPAKPALLTIADLPPWRDPNPFILTGYRRQSRSFAASFASWLYWHNESCNIYSHLIPGTVLVILLGQGALYDHVHSRRPDLEPFDAAVLALQAVTAAFCFLVSAAYHTLVDHSPGVAHRWLQLDYVGIITLILGNFVSGLHFGFYCTKPLKYFYWALVSTLPAGRVELMPRSPLS